jgi:hypothetical protein
MNQAQLAWKKAITDWAKAARRQRGRHRRTTSVKVGMIRVSQDRPPAASDATASADVSVPVPDRHNAPRRGGRHA